MICTPADAVSDFLFVIHKQSRPYCHVWGGGGVVLLGQFGSGWSFSSALKKWFGFVQSDNFWGNIEMPETAVPLMTP